MVLQPVGAADGVAGDDGPVDDADTADDYIVAGPAEAAVDGKDSVGSRDVEDAAELGALGVVEFDALGVAGAALGARDGVGREGGAASGRRWPAGADPANSRGAPCAAVF